MKKSTLITTIAMIVVVVVALSTATYAWFSSTSTAIANTSFTTEVSGDWTIMLGTVDGDNFNDLQYVGSAADTIDLTTIATNINTGLWCPTSAIETIITDSNAATTLADRANFVQAEKTGTLYNIKKLQTPVMNGASAATGNEGVIKPFALRLVNVSGKTQVLQLNITVNAKSTGTTNSMYAAAAVRFYVYEVTNTSPDANEDGVMEGNTYTSGYRLTGTAGLDELNSITGAITETTAEPKSANLKTITSYTEDTPNYTNVTMADYTVGDISEQFIPAGANPSAALTAIGIEANDRYITYSFDLSTYAANAFSNIIIYTWIDGWTANASASQASFTVNYGFVSNPAYKAHNA